jgi:Tol biopolymer transport system component
MNAPGGAAGWTQPAYTANGQGLIVVRRDYAFSDVYITDLQGHIRTQLTHDSNGTVELNHWAFYPHQTADGGTVFFSYDAKDPFENYNVVLSVYAMPMTATTIRQAKRWTTPERFTGGDVQPIPLGSGGVVYTKYGYDQTNNKILAQVWQAPRAGVLGHALTPAQDDCSQPSLSPDGTRLAMICTAGKAVASLDVASFDGANLGARQVVASGQLVAQPTWAPDSSGLLYIAPQGIAGHFQLWWQLIPMQLPPPATPTPAAPPRGARVSTATPTPAAPASPAPTPTPLPPAQQLTTDLNFDATSTIAWR